MTPMLTLIDAVVVLTLLALMVACWNRPIRRLLIGAAALYSAWIAGRAML